jgi:co-chaperonin GroES (HSP10)
LALRKRAVKMFRLVDDKIAVSFDAKAKDELSDGGIVLPNQQSDFLECVVVATGPGKRATNVMVSDENVRWDGDEASVPDFRLPMSVKEGDTVLISAYTGTPIKYEGNDYKIMGELEVVAIL